MTRIQAVAFDLDGTLVDSAGGVALALNAALTEVGLAPFELPTVRGWIGDGPDVLIARALFASAVDDGEIPALAARMRRCFDAATLRAPMAGSSVYSGIADTVRALAARLPVVVVTNKPTALARAVLKEAGLLSHFAALHGADQPAQRKPSPLLIQQAAAKLGTATRHLLMVGDSVMDVAAAHAAGSPAAWAGWGYGHAHAAAIRGVWPLHAPQELLAAPILAAAAHNND
jgi:phosphoglycolate phosphatase